MPRLCKLEESAAVFEIQMGYQHHSTNDAVRAAELESSLELYLQVGAASIRKAAFEWRLAASLQAGGPIVVPPHSAWPQDRLKRPSGACLLFVASQCDPDSRPLSVLPPGLRSLPAIPGPARAMLADAWLRQPETLALGDPDLRRRFAHWLAAYPPAIGTCLLAAAARGDDASLVGQLAEAWFARGLSHSGAPAQVARMASLEPLTDIARRSLHLTMGLFFHDDDALVRLLEPALDLGEPERAMTLSETLMARAPQDGIRRRALVVRLAALADASHPRELAEEYRRRWLPTGWSYPWPERLLYVLQQAGATDLERHLFETMQIDEKTPRWVLLARETLDTEVIGRAHLEAWQEVYMEAPRDERILMGVTEVVLRSPLPLKKTWTERLGLRARWEQLAAFSVYRELASANLVLLHTEDEDRILEFESRLETSSLATVPLLRAAQAYFAALRRTKQWDRILWIERQDPTKLHRACPFKDRELIRLMTRLTVLPVDRKSERAWCGSWEDLISLPLNPQEVAEVLDHFVNLRTDLETRGHLQYERTLFDDVMLQVLRRAKAEAETLILRIDLPATEWKNLRERLRQSSPEATLHILRNLLVKVE